MSAILRFCAERVCLDAVPGRLSGAGRAGVYVSVSYKGIRRKGESNDSEFGSNEKSWRLVCSDNSFSAWHNNTRTKMRPPSCSSRSKRVWVYLDCPAGTLSFYSVSDKNRLTHLHTFHSTFPEPLYAGFGLCSGSSVSLCQTETSPHTKNTTTWELHKYCLNIKKSQSRTQCSTDTLYKKLWNHYLKNNYIYFYIYYILYYFTETKAKIYVLLHHE